MEETADRIDFFISHAGVDRTWASWIAQQLVSAGYSVILDTWDWGPGTDFIELMQQALQKAERILTVWTPAYFAQRYSSLELRAAFARHLQEGGRLLPVIVEPCDIPDLYSTLTRVDLIGVTAATAQEYLLRAVAPSGGSAHGRTLVSSTSPSDATLTMGYPGKTPAVWNIPPRNPNFTGRADLLAELKDRLTKNATVVVNALYGLGGVGKTELAIEYSYRNVGMYDLAWWIPSEQPSLAPSGLAALAERLGIVATSQGKATEAILNMLSERGRWLLIFDNANSADEIANFVPRGSGNVIITSRNPVWGELGSRLAVDVLSRTETIALIRRRISINDDIAWHLGEELGDLPLAITQASAYLEQTAMDPAEYVNLFREHREPFLSLGLLAGSDNNLATVWTVSLRRLRKDSMAAVQLLHLASLLGPESIPLSLFSQHPELLPRPLSLVAPDPFKLAVAAGTIAGYSLGRHSSGRLYLHRLIQAAIRSRISPQLRAKNCETVRNLIVAFRPGDPNDPPTWPLYDDLLPHLLAAPALDLNKDADLRSIALDCLWSLYVRGQLIAGDQLAQQLRAEWEAEMGKLHPDVLTASNHHAAVNYALGRYDTARALHEATLAGRRTLFGDEHLDTLASITGLAITLNAMGDFSNAQRLHEEAYRKYCKLFGKDHLDTLRSATGLANTLSNSGNHSRAVEIHKDTLARRRRLLPPDHPAIDRSANNLAWSLYHVGEITLARNLFQECLERRTEILGPDHPDSLHSATGLAYCLARLADYEGAYRLHKDTLARRVRIFGKNTTATLRSLLGLAESTYGFCDYAEAYTLFREAAAIARTVYDENHSDVIRALIGAAHCSIQLEDYPKAQEIYETMIAPSQATWDDDQRDRVSSLRLLRQLLSDSDKH